MSNAYMHEPLDVYGKGIHAVVVSWLPNGSSDPAAASVLGPYVSSVVLTSTGLWTITLEDNFKPSAFLGGSFYARDNANVVARIPKLGTVDIASSPCTVTCYNLDNDLAVQNIAANAASICRAVLFFKMNPVKDATGHGGL